MKKAFPFLFTFFILFLYSCTVNSTYTNRKKDKKEAEAIATQFFNYLKQQKYQETFDLFSDELLNVASKEKVYEIYNYTKQNLGKLRKTDLVAWETKVVEGTNASANYLLKYKNTYDSSSAIEIIRLTKDKQNHVKILYYNIDSDKFYKK